MFLPIACFGFMLAMAQYESSLYFVTLCMGVSYLIHKSTDKKEEKNDYADTI
jgi:hypothetical protein